MNKIKAVLDHCAYLICKGWAKNALLLEYKCLYVVLGIEHWDILQQGEYPSPFNIFTECVARLLKVLLTGCGWSCLSLPNTGNTVEYHPKWLNLNLYSGMTNDPQTGARL